MSIVNCGSDERGKYSGGKAGDQTKKEFCVRPWYSRPWLCVLRHPDKAVQKKIAEIAKAAANNENIGYDQNQRLSFFNELKAANWKPKSIKKKCEADCSSSTAAIIIAVGYILNIPKLKKVNPSLTTHYMRKALIDAGFKLLTDSKYKSSEDYLLEGDVLLNDGHHVAINVTNGSKAVSKSTSSPKKTSSSKAPKVASASPNLAKGSKGAQVGLLQKDLKFLGFKGKDGKALVEDDDFGSNTEYALKSFQKKHGLVEDGIYGSKSAAKMSKLLK